MDREKKTIIVKRYECIEEKEVSVDEYKEVLKILGDLLDGHRAIIKGDIIYLIPNEIPTQSSLTAYLKFISDLSPEFKIMIRKIQYYLKQLGQLLGEFNRKVGRVLREIPKDKVDVSR